MAAFTLIAELSGILIVVVLAWTIEFERRTRREARQKDAELRHLSERIAEVQAAISRLEQWPTNNSGALPPEEEVNSVRALLKRLVNDFPDLGSEPEYEGEVASLLLETPDRGEDLGTQPGAGADERVTEAVALKAALRRLEATSMKRF
jgi:hypothetical protein